MNFDRECKTLNEIYVLFLYLNIKTKKRQAKVNREKSIYSTRKPRKTDWQINKIKNKIC